MGVKVQPVLYNSMTYETYVPQSYHPYTILTRLPPSNMTMHDIILLGIRKYAKVALRS